MNDWVSWHSHGESQKSTVPEWIASLRGDYTIPTSVADLPLPHEHICALGVALEVYAQGEYAPARLTRVQRLKFRVNSLRERIALRICPWLAYNEYD